jgi:hypothetical protein
MTFSQTYQILASPRRRVGDTDATIHSSIHLSNPTHHTNHIHTMPYFTSSEEWQRQSALLLQARPNTVRLLLFLSFPSTTTSTFPSALSSPANTHPLTDTHNNKIPHPLHHIHIPQTFLVDTNRRTRHHKINPTNRSPRAKNL